MNPAPSSPRKPLVIKTSRKEIAIGIGATVLLVALLAWGFVLLSKQVPDNNLTGTITAKHFTPRPPETQITIGQGGLAERHDDGDYTFDIHVASEDHDYILYVDKTLWDQKNVGDEITFVRPPKGE